MESTAPSSPTGRLLRGKDCLCVILSFFSQREQHHLQLLSKKFYSQCVPLAYPIKRFFFREVKEHTG